MLRICWKRVTSGELVTVRVVIGQHSQRAASYEANVEHVPKATKLDEETEMSGVRTESAALKKWWR
jgi:hypothetical protein